MKKGVLVQIIALVLCLTAVSGFEVSKEKIKDTITLDGLAEYNITIHNNLDTTQYYKIRTLDYPVWDVYTKPVRNPIVVEVVPRSQSSVRLFVDPLHVLSVGTVDVNIRIASLDSKEIKIVPLRVSIVSTGSLIQGYVPTVIANVKISQDGEETISIDPRRQFTLHIRLDNQNPLDYDELTIKLNSNTMNKEIREELAPNEKKELEVEVKIDPKTEPQEDTLVVSINSGDKVIVDPMISKFRIEEYTNIEKETIPKNGFLKVKNQVVFTNTGNSEYTGVVETETTPFRSLFTLTDPKGKIVAKDGGRYIQWSAELGPGESKTFVVDENYTVMLVLAILIVIGVLVYYIYKSPLVINKEASNIEKREGGISDFKVVLTITNRGSVPIKDIAVSDKIPKIADVERELSIGTLQPTKILKHDKKGTLIKWIIDDLAPGEERVITYHIKSILTILGEFNLPAATARFTFKDNQRTAKSNSLTISS